MTVGELVSLAGPLLNVLLVPILRTLWHIERRLTILETIQEHQRTRQS
jgi:hypothetical protein